MASNDSQPIKPRKPSKLLNILEANGSTSNWEIPPFPKSELNHDSDEKPDVRQFVSRGNQVEYEDWVVLEMKQTNGEMLDLRPKDSESNPDPVVFERLNYKSPSYNQRIDRGTTTDDIPGDINYHEKIVKLQIRFPRAALAHIEEVLKACYGDITWAMNLLDQFQDEHFDSDISQLNHCKKSTSSNQTGPRSNPKKDCDKVENGCNNFYSIYLDPAAAIALQETFGQILKNEDRDEELLRIKISPSVAQLLHRLWKETYEDSLSKKSALRPRTNSSPRKTPPKAQKPPSSLVSCQPKSDLEEIMELQEACELSLKEYNRQNNQLDKKNLATKMKWEELVSIYPGLNEQTLSEIFESHNYNLVETIESINASCGITLSIPSLERPSLDDEDLSDIQQPLTRRTAEDKGGLESLRWEMFDCKEKRRELLDNARRCYHAKKFAVASYYTNQAQELSKELSNLKEKVIDWVLLANPSNTLDLHGVRADEVLATLASYFSIKEEELSTKKTDRIDLNIITGRGAHSSKGPKLKPMVINYLTQKKYKFSVPNPGMIRVTIYSSMFT